MKESPMAKPPNDDYDGAWKAALGVYLQEFLALCFPAIHAAIDWARPYRFLDTELQRATSDDQQGRRTADKLVEVWGRDGVAAWVVIHIEVQSQDVGDFARRMFQYHYRLRDRFDRPIVSVAVLGDDRPPWRRSARARTRRGGCRPSWRSRAGCTTWATAPSRCVWPLALSTGCCACQMRCAGSLCRSFGRLRRTVR